MIEWLAMIETERHESKMAQQFNENSRSRQNSHANVLELKHAPREDRVGATWQRTATQVSDQMREKQEKKTYI
jgi:hypothetical protein